MRRLVFFAGLSLSLGPGAAAFASGASTAPVAIASPVAVAPSATPAASAGAGSLDQALASISADNIRADIFFLASDELEGRDTPSPGQRIAARFIRSRLQRLGFQPGAPSGYLYEYPLYLPRIDAARTTATVSRGDAKDTWTLGSDYYFAARELSDIDLQGGVVFCESGRRNDAPSNLAGHWALCLDDGKTVSDIVSAMTDAGALGVLMTPGPKYDKKPYEERFGRELPMLQRAGVQWPSNAAKSEPRLPMLWVTPTAAARLAPEIVGPDAKKAKSGQRVEGEFHHTRGMGGDKGVIQCENVCGFWPGADPKLKDEVIIVSAHYDHVGRGPRGDEIHNGADDNGSGTTGLLALAEALATHGPLRRSVLLMWVSGEEKGLFGSRAWTEHPWLPNGARPVCDINIDMIGRNEPDKLLITPTRKREEYNGLVRLAESLCEQEGFPALGSCDAYWDRSDHANFARNLKIPVTFLFSDIHEDYHKPTDDPDKIDYDKVRRVARLVLRMIAGLQDDQLKL